MTDRGTRWVVFDEDDEHGLTMRPMSRMGVCFWKNQTKIGRFWQEVLLGGGGLYWDT